MSWSIYYVHCKIIKLIIITLFLSWLQAHFISMIILSWIESHHVLFMIVNVILIQTRNSLSIIMCYHSLLSLLQLLKLSTLKCFSKDLLLFHLLYLTSLVSLLFFTEAADHKAVHDYSVILLLISDSYWHCSFTASSCELNQYHKSWDQCTKYYDYQDF